MASLSEMRLELRTKIGSPTTTDVPDALLTRLLNEAYRDIGTKHPFHETRQVAYMTTTSGTGRYNLPSDATIIRRVWDATNGRRLEKAGQRLASERRGADLLQNGFPRSYIRAGTYLQLHPVPDGAYTIYVYYSSAVADLTDDADVPVLPLPWHTGIVKYARYLFWDERGDINKAQYSYSAYKLWLADKPSELDEEKADMEGGVEIPSLAPQWHHDARSIYDEN